MALDVGQANREGACERTANVSDPLMLPITQLESATLKDAGLNMTAASGMRDLAHRLVTYEAGVVGSSEPMESPTLRVYEKLRHSLSEFVGVAGFQSLALRALMQARPGGPSLSRVRITADGSLQGLGEIETQIDMDKDWTGEEGIILIARLLELLGVFLGETLTYSLLRNAWPGEALDGSNSVHGRKV